MTGDGEIMSRTYRWCLGQGQLHIEAPPGYDWCQAEGEQCVIGMTQVGQMAPEAYLKGRP